SSQSRSPAPERGAIEESRPAPEERPSPTPAHPGHSLLKPASLLPSSISLDEIAREIAEQVEWKGVFLRKVRESRRVTIEELSEHTKISRSYLTAIENE